MQLQEAVARENRLGVVVSELTEKNTELEMSLMKAKKNLGLYGQRAKQLDARVRSLAEAEQAQNKVLYSRRKIKSNGFICDHF